MANKKPTTLQSAKESYNNLQVQDKMELFKHVEDDLKSIYTTKTESVANEQETIANLKSLVLNDK